MFEGGRTTEFEAVCDAVEIADLKDSLLAVCHCPCQILEIRVLVLADDDVVLREVGGHIADFATSTPGVDCVCSGADVVDVKLAVIVGIGGVEVVLALVKCRDRRVFVVA